MFFWGSNKHRNQWWASKEWKNSQRNFKEIFINIVEKSSGTKPSSLGDSSNHLLDETTVGKIIDIYRDHLSVIAIKLSVTQNGRFNLPHTTTQDVNEIINYLSSGKATGPVGIPVKFIKLSANTMDSHLTDKHYK